MCRAPHFSAHPGGGPACPRLPLHMRAPDAGRACSPRGRDARRRASRSAPSPQRPHWAAHPLCLSPLARLCSVAPSLSHRSSSTMWSRHAHYREPQFLPPPPLTLARCQVRSELRQCPVKPPCMLYRHGKGRGGCVTMPECFHSSPEHPTLWISLSIFTFARIRTIASQGSSREPRRLLTLLSVTT